MTQRIFDIENEKDMQDLWEILPEKVVRIEKDETPEGNSYNRYYAEDYCYGGCAFIKINWHNKTEITRPMDYESMIGCVGWFWDNDDEEKSLGVLTEYAPARKFHFVKGNIDNTYFHFHPAKKSELKFWEDD